jgi:hypothetical protein
MSIFEIVLHVAVLAGCLALLLDAWKWRKAADK